VKANSSRHQSYPQTTSSCSQRWESCPNQTQSPITAGSASPNTRRRVLQETQSTRSTGTSSSCSAVTEESSLQQTLRNQATAEGIARSWR